MDEVKKRIIVADDDPGILDVMKIILEDVGGYEVDTINDGLKLNNIDENNLPDLIILDLWMSGINGSEICKRLKGNSKTRNIPVVIFSANKDIKSIALQVGAEDYISKPFQMNDLLAKIKSLTE